MNINFLEMHPIALPFKDRNFRFRDTDSGREIWDICRKKFVTLQPEEWVRQHIIHALVFDLKYPAGMIAVEKSILLGKVRRRYDLVVYAPDLKPFLLVECKAPDVQISDTTLLQISHYYTQIPAAFLMLSNGSYTLLAGLQSGRIVWQTSMPDYPSPSI